MGYRHYIGVLDKSKLGIIKDMTLKQLSEYLNEEHVGPGDVTNEVHELGKYYDDKFMKPFKSNVFSKPATNKHFKSDYDLYIISKEGFEAIIDDYRKHVLKYYESLLNPDPNDPFPERRPTPESDIKEKIEVWGRNCTKFKLYPYNMKGEEITTSWKYEHAIFELVRIYKTIDWDAQVATISAH
jgi:hypothetical protein